MRDRNVKAAFDHFVQHIDAWLTACALQRRPLYHELTIGCVIDGFGLTDELVEMLKANYKNAGWKVTIKKESCYKPWESPYTYLVIEE